MKKLYDFRNRSNADSGGTLAVSKKRVAFILIVAMLLTSVFFTSTVNAGTKAAKRHVPADPAAEQNVMKHASGRNSSAKNLTLNNASRHAATVKE